MSECKTAFTHLLASLDTIRVAYQAKERATQAVIEMMQEFAKKHPDAELIDLPKIDRSLWLKINMKVDEIEDIRQAIADLRRVKTELRMDTLFKSGSSARMFGSTLKHPRFQKISRHVIGYMVDKICRISKTANLLIADELSDRQKKYRKYFRDVMKKWDIKSPQELNEANRKKFFDEVDAGWNAKENETD